MRSLVLELSSEKWGGGRSRQTGWGRGAGRGGKCRPELLPSLSRGSAQDPPSPCTGDEMRRGSLADSGTIICTSWGERVPGQPRLFSLPDPGGNPELPDSQEVARPLPLPFLSAGSVGTRARVPSTKLLTKHFVFLHKSPGVLHYVLTLCGALCPMCHCLQGQAERQVAGHRVLGLTWGTQEACGS